MTTYQRSTATANANGGGTITKQGRTPRTTPFDMSGVVRTDDGILRYSTLAPSLLDMFRASVDRHPDRECIVVLGGERVTYRQVWDRSARVAGGLRAAGVQPGDRVANRHGNGLEWCLGFWGTLMAGAVVVPVNTRFSESEVAYVVTDSGATVVLLPDAPLPDGEPYVTTDADHETLAALFYTSGTTGFPKGAMTTHENFLSNSETCLRVLRIPPDMHVRNLVSVPLFHATGCNSQLIPTTQLGGTTVIMPTFEVQAFLRAAVDEQINILTSAPAIFWLAMSQPNFAEFDLSNVGWVTYGGAPTAPDVIGRLRSVVPERPPRQWLRADRDLVGVHVPAGRVRGAASGDRRFRRAAGRGRPARPRPDDWRRRTADPRPERRRRLLEQTGEDGGNVRRRLVAHRRPRAHRRGGLRPDRRPPEGHDQPRRRERVLRRGRERTRRSTPRCSRSPCSACPTR